MKRTPIWRWAAVACHLSALLAPGAWLYFVRHAGTSFRWAGFTGRNLLVCLVLSLLPTALFFLVFVGVLTIVFGALEKKLDYFR